MSYDEHTKTLIRAEDQYIHQGVYVFPQGVEIIDSNAFRNISGLVKLVIPNTVKTIRQYAINNCPDLKEITFAPSSSLTGYEKYPFSLLPKLKYLSLPIAAANPFFDCPKLEQITFLENITTLAADIFPSTHQVKTLILPDTIIAIKPEVLTNEDSIKHIYIDTHNPEKLTSIRNLLSTSTQAPVTLKQKPFTEDPSFYLNTFFAIAAVGGMALCIAAIVVFSSPFTIFAATAGILCLTLAGVGFFDRDCINASERRENLSIKATPS